MKILQISPQFPFPANDGGRIGIASIFTHFSKFVDEVNLIAFSNSKVNSEALKLANEYGKIHLIDFSPKYTAKKLFKSIISNKPLYFDKHSDKSNFSVFHSIAEKCDFDVIHVDHSYMMPYGLALSKSFRKPCGLRLHNIEAYLWKRYAERYAIYHPAKYYLERQFRLMTQNEARMIDLADVSFAITEKEKSIALELAPSANVVIASAGIDPDYWNYSEANIESKTVDDAKSANDSVFPDFQDRISHDLIIATIYSWIHNFDGVKWFINKVLPLVRSMIPESRLILIGKNLPETLKKQEKSGVDGIGYVDDVRPWFNRAGIYIAPLFVGAGIRIKILEAMAMALPVVATKVSAEGINANQEQGLFVTDNPNEMADIIMKLIKNPQLARMAGLKGRDFVLQNFSWSKNVEIMVNEYRKLINRQQ